MWIFSKTIIISTPYSISQMISPYPRFVYPQYPISQIVLPPISHIPDCLQTGDRRGILTDTRKDRGGGGGGRTRDTGKYTPCANIFILNPFCAAGILFFIKNVLTNQIDGLLQAIVYKCICTRIYTLYVIYMKNAVSCVCIIPLANGMVGINIY